MTEISNENKKKIEKLQLLEQNVNSLMSQKQQFQTTLLENESALKELEKTKKAYRIIGNIMVESTKSKLKKDLTSKKEMLEIRINAIEKQERNLRKKASEIQKDVLKSMKD